MNAELKALQRTLNRLGFEAGAEDGLWGRRTAAAFERALAAVQPPRKVGPLFAGRDAAVADVLEAQLKRDEGLRLHVYRCTAGKLTIGYGRNLDDVGIRPSETEVLGITRESCIERGITKEQAEALLRNDIEDVFADLDRALPWWDTLDVQRRAVVANMRFNLGLRKLLGFRNTLAAMDQRRFRDAAAGMRASLWARQVGARAERLAQIMEANA